MPLDRCFEIHLSGCAIDGERFLDLHHGVLLDAQLTMLERLLERCPNVRAITYEDPAFDAARALEAQSLGGFVPGPFDPTLPAKLEHLTMPILLTWGEDDQLTPVGRLEAWRAALPQAQARVFPFGGHLVFHEQREAVDAIGDFAAV